MIKEFFTKYRTFLLKEFVLLVLALFVSITIGRWYEFGLIIFNHGWAILNAEYAILSTIHDLQISILLTPLLLLFFLLLFAFSSRETAQKLKALIVAVIAAGHILLISYFGATLNPLGAEFWGYSTVEMANTVIASEQITYMSLSAFVVLFVVIYWACHKIFSLDFSVGTLKKTIPGIGILVFSPFLLLNILEINKTIDQSEREKQANKLSYFINQGLASVELLNQSKSYSFEDYPLIRKAQKEDVLGPYFKELDDPPNIVFLLVESLGGEFVGANGQWTGFAPYLDDLSEKSLYWQNGLSLSGRTFGFVPSLLGSLPFGKNGFMDLGPNYPRHQSLFSLLKEKGYYTAFFSGYNTSFDGLDFFLEYQDLDFVLNKKKIDSLFPDTGDRQNYWGADDKTLFNLASGILDTTDSFPRLEVYHTLQSHSPFNVPDQQKYEQQFDQQLASLEISSEKREIYQRYRSELTSLMYTDQAINNFLQAYQEREEFENTIFIITGDHWLIPIPQTSAISRYHVPIMIYSPKLKKQVRFESVNTHAEIVPTLTAFLDQQTRLSIPDSAHWIGGVMDTTKHFQSKRSIPFMRNKNQISDYLHQEYYLYGDAVYELKQGLSLEEKEDNTIKNRLVNKLSDFKSLNDYVTANDKIYPGESIEHQKYQFITKYDTLFARLDSLDLSVDEQFERAQLAAFGGKYDVARAIAKRILLKNPMYHDVRILIGRTHAWEEEHSVAKKYYEQVMEYDSTYYDVYNAYFDSEYWDGNYQNALEIIQRGLKHHPGRKEFIERKEKVRSKLAETDNAS